MSELTCVVCGKVLASPLDQYGPSGSVRCWQCWSQDHKTDDEEMMVNAMDDLKNAIIAESRANDDLLWAEAEIRNAKKTLKKMYSAYPWLELRVSEIETRYG